MVGRQAENIAAINESPYCKNALLYCNFSWSIDMLSLSMNVARDYSKTLDNLQAIYGKLDHLKILKLIHI